MAERRAARFGPLAGPPAQRVTASPGAEFALRPVVTYERAEADGRARIQDGLLRPVDSHKADLEGALLAWIPVWRIDAAVEGFHLGLRTIGGGATRARVIPTGGVRQRDAVLIVPGRAVLAYDIAPRLTLDVADLVPRGALGDVEGEWLDPDVPRDRAEHEAGERLRGRVTPARALVARYEVRVRAAALCHVPVWIRRYRYEAEATGGAPFEGHVALSARDGAVLSERHPPAISALTGHVRRWLRR